MPSTAATATAATGIRYFFIASDTQIESVKHSIFCFACLFGVAASCEEYGSSENFRAVFLIVR